MTSAPTQKVDSSETARREKQIDTLDGIFENIRGEGRLLLVTWLSDFDPMTEYGKSFSDFYLTFLLDAGEWSEQDVLKSATLVVQFCEKLEQVLALSKDPFPPPLFDDERWIINRPRTAPARPYLRRVVRDVLHDQPPAYSALIERIIVFTPEVDPKAPIASLSALQRHLDWLTQKAEDDVHGAPEKHVKYYDFIRSCDLAHFDIFISIFIFVALFVALYN